MLSRSVLLFLVSLFLLIGPGSGLAQVTIDFVERYVDIEIYYPDQGIMRDGTGSYEAGVFDEEVDLTWFSTTARARNTTTALYDETSINISGSQHAAIEFDGDLAPRYVRVRAKSMAYFSIASAGTYEFVANLEGRGVIFQIGDEDNQVGIIGRDLEIGETILTGSLPHSGTYTVEVISSNYEMSMTPRSSTLQFSLRVESGGAVVVTESTWGAVKALYR